MEFLTIFANFACFYLLGFFMGGGDMNRGFELADSIDVPNQVGKPNLTQAFDEVMKVAAQTDRERTYQKTPRKPASAQLRRVSQGLKAYMDDSIVSKEILKAIDTVNPNPGKVPPRVLKASEYEPFMARPDETREAIQKAIHRLPAGSHFYERYFMMGILSRLNVRETGRAYELAEEQVNQAQVRENDPSSRWESALLIQAYDVMAKNSSDPDSLLQSTVAAIGRHSNQPRIRRVISQGFARRYPSRSEDLVRALSDFGVAMDADPLQGGGVHHE